MKFTHDLIERNQALLIVLAVVIAVMVVRTNGRTDWEDRVNTTFWCIWTGVQLKLN